jgi:hypothetical protein
LALYCDRTSFTFSESDEADINMPVEQPGEAERPGQGQSKQGNEEWPLSNDTGSEVIE